MTKRKHLVKPLMRTWLRLFASLLFICGLFIPSSTTGADEPVPTPEIEQPTQEKVPTETLIEMKELERSSKSNPKLESSLNQLLETHRRESLAGAKAFAATHMMTLDNDRVQVVIVATREAMNDLKEAIETLGGEYQGHYETLLQALVPVDALESLAGRTDVQVVREPRRPIPLAPMQVGNQTTEGVAASNASAWHTAGYDGTGVRVAVIDGGFTDYASLLGTDLPASVTTYDWTGTGMSGSPHGTACAEIIYDMAYGATMDLHKISTEVELGNAVSQAIADGVDIISMSLGWTINGPGDGTGSLANIVNNARSNGIFFAVAAGNDAEVSWSGQYVDHPNASGTHRWPHGSNVNCFGPGTPDFTCRYISAGYPIVLGLHWDDWTAVNQDYDLYLMRWTGSAWSTVASSIAIQNGGAGQTPEEAISIYAPYTAVYGVMVVRYSATRNVCLSLNAPKMTHLDEWVTQRSLSFPADSPDAITVGAVDVSSPYPLESYSSRGPTFGPGGACSGGSTKPDIAAYANVSTVSYGAGEFNGTSAATPHVAGAAALVKEAYPGYTVSQLQDYLEDEALDLGTTGKDNLFGSGRLYLPEPNAPPTIWGLPDQTLPVNTSRDNAIDLWDYAADAESPDSALTFTIDNTPDPNAGVSIDSNRYIDVNPTPGWVGQTDIIIRATDPGNLSDTDSFQVMVTDPNMGQLRGTVTSDRPGGPLEDALVEVISGTASITSGTTDSSGFYSPWWLMNGAYTVTVSADGYVTDTQTVTITAQQTTTHDVTLTLYAPQIEVTPGSYDEVLAWGAMVTRVMSITNNGPVALEFEIAKQASGSAPLAGGDTWLMGNDDATADDIVPSPAGSTNVTSTAANTDTDDNEEISLREQYEADVKVTQLNEARRLTAPQTIHPLATKSSLAVTEADTDDDGMPDAWETANGLNPSDPSDAWQDPDGDDVINLFEYQLGSDPNNASTPTIVTVSAGEDVEAAIGAALTGQVVRVEGGTYNVNYATFTPKTIMIQGGWNSDFTHRDLGATPTIFDGQSLDEVLYFSFDSGTNSVILDGLTLTNGEGFFGAFNMIAKGTSSMKWSVTNCAIVNSTGSLGGATYIIHWDDSESDVLIINSVIARNDSSGIRNQTTETAVGRWKIINSDITNNQRLDAGEAHGIDAFTLDDAVLIATLKNTILWGNQKTDLDISRSITVDAEHSDIGTVNASSGATYNPGTGMIDSDPLFVAPDDGDFTLQEESPCIDAGTNSGVPPTDFEGDPRPIDGDNSGSAEWDIGADEFTFTDVDVPWLPGKSITGTVPAYSTVPVAITFDAAQVDQPGVYQASLRVSSDDPYNPTVSVPVTMTVILSPILSISKTDIPDPVQAGGLLTYTIVVQNTGSVDATGVVISDTIPANTTFAWADSGGTLVGDQVCWTDKTVNASGSLTVTFAVSVASPLPNDAIITNDNYGVSCDEEASAFGSPVTTTVQSTPALSISKTDTPDPVQVGNVLTYTIVVQNTGNANATGVTISDTIPANTTFAWADSGGSLAGDQVRWAGKTVNANGSLTMTYGVTVTDPLPDGAIITNADYGAICTEGVSAAGSPVTTTVQGVPALNISKTATPDPVQAGGILTYTIVVQNNGNADATGVAITDTIPLNTTFAWADSGGVSADDRVQWTGKTVNAGDSLTATFVVTVISPLPNGTIIINEICSVTCDRGGSAVSNPVTTTVQSAPILSIAKTDMPDPVQAGGILTYTIVVQNAGNANATGVVISDTIPANTTFAWADSGGFMSGDQVRWTGKTVNASGSLAVTFAVSVVSPLPNGTTITNGDYGVSCNEGVGTVGGPVTTAVQSAPVLSIAKTDDPDLVQAGDRLTYTIVVQNSGNANATGVVISDTIPANTTFAWADSGGTLVGDQVRWTSKTVNASGSLTVTFVVSVASPLPNDTIITNDNYGASCDEGVSTVGTPMTTTVQSIPELNISKTGSPDPVQAGGLLTYTIVVENTGNANATGVIISDTVPANTTFVSADSDGGLVGNQVRWTGKTVPGGGSLTVTFAVLVASPLPNDTIITNDDYGVTCAEGVNASGIPVTTTVQSTPVLGISKTSGPDPVQAGDLLTYTIVVQNTGNANATDVTISDTIPANTTFASADSGGSLEGDQVRWTDLTAIAGTDLVVRFAVTIGDVPDGTLITNADFRVTSAEGASAVGSPVITTVNVVEDSWQIYLPLVVRNKSTQ